MMFRDQVQAAARISISEVASVLASEGLSFNRELHTHLRTRLTSYGKANLFLKCIVDGARWAGFVGDDPAWPADGIRFLQWRTPFIKQKYRKGFHQGANPIAYLESWDAVLSHANVATPPDEASTAPEVVNFHLASTAVLRQLDWRRERSWLGPWTFHAAFKIYLLHENRLWTDSNIDAVTMPMGGSGQQRFFEGGWNYLVKLGVLDPLPAVSGFGNMMSAAEVAHAAVQGLAAHANSRPIHLNSGIHRLGSPN